RMGDRSDQPRRVSRRTALTLLGSGAGLALLAACAPIGEAPAKPAGGAPSATTAAAPAKPAEAAKPATDAKPTAAAQAAPKPAGQPKTGGTLLTGQPYDISRLDGHANSYTSAD